MAMSPPVTTNIGVENKTCVDTGKDIVEHAKLKATGKLRAEGGAPILGGQEEQAAPKYCKHEILAAREEW